MSEGFELELLSASDHQRIRAHYGRAIPWLEKHFGGTPLIAVSFPTGWAGVPAFHKSFDALPASVETVAVRTSTGVHPYVKLNAHTVTWVCAAHYAVELDGWGPTLDDPDRVAFARLVLSPHGSVTEDAVFAGAHVLRETLEAQGLDAIVVLDGFRGLTLWIPFADGPGYDRVAPWLHAFAADAAASDPQRFTVAPLRAERGDRIYLGTKSNHPGMGTLLPYALRGTPSLEVSLPVAWKDLGKVRNGEVTEGGFAEFMRLFGDVFAHERTRIGQQLFGDRGAAVPVRPTIVATTETAPRNFIIAAALAVLADGKAHDADDILAQGRARGLLPDSTTRKYVYTALHEYVVRTLGAGRSPEFVQVTGTASFRLSGPVDTWPDIVLPAVPTWISDADVASLTERLQTTSIGGDPAAFEIAVCDAFAALGFVATHIGGEGQPDGVLAAPLGVAGYRVILECKTASPSGIVANPRPEEPAKFRAAAGATKSMLIGPAFGNDASLDDELRMHDVALWTVDDLVTAVSHAIGPDELRPAMEAGRVEASIRSLLWERQHGRPKRVAVIAQRLARAAWQTQVMLAKTVAIAETPSFSEDTLFVLTDETLASEGVVTGAHLDETREAIASLLHTGVLQAFEDGFVVVRPQPKSDVPLPSG